MGCPETGFGTFVGLTMGYTGSPPIVDWRAFGSTRTAVLAMVERFLIENGLSDYYLTSIISGPAGSLWIGTANAGLMKLGQ
jgi:hypothetical protein